MGPPEAVSITPLGVNQRYGQYQSKPVKADGEFCAVAFGSEKLCHPQDERVPKG
jgi:hypothetical protein